MKSMQRKKQHLHRSLILNWYRLWEMWYIADVWVIKAEWWGELKWVFVKMCFIRSLYVHISVTSMHRMISNETNNVHKSHGWQLRELNPCRQRKASGEKILGLYSPVLPRSLSLYLAVVNLLKICGQKFSTTQVDGPTTNPQTRTQAPSTRRRVGSRKAEQSNFPEE